MTGQRILKIKTLTKEGFAGRTEVVIYTHNDINTLHIYQTIITKQNNIGNGTIIRKTDRYTVLRSMVGFKPETYKQLMDFLNKNVHVNIGICQ